MLNTSKIQKEKPDMQFQSLATEKHIELSLTFSVRGTIIAKSGYRNNRQRLDNS